MKTKFVQSILLSTLFVGTITLFGWADPPEKEKEKAPPPEMSEQSKEKPGIEKETFPPMRGRGQMLHPMREMRRERMRDPEHCPFWQDRGEEREIREPRAGRPERRRRHQQMEMCCPRCGYPEKPSFREAPQRRGRYGRYQGRGPGRWHQGPPSGMRGWGPERFGPMGPRMERERFGYGEDRREREYRGFRGRQHPGPGQEFRGRFGRGGRFGAERFEGMSPPPMLGRKLYELIKESHPELAEEVKEDIREGDSPREAMRDALEELAERDEKEEREFAERSKRRFREERRARMHKPASPEMRLFKQIGQKFHSIDNPEERERIRMRLRHQLEKRTQEEIDGVSEKLERLEQRLKELKENRERIIKNKEERILSPE